MSLLTNDEVQDSLYEAIGLLPSDSSDLVLRMKVDMVRNILTLTALHSESRNGIPSLMGVGLEEALNLAAYVKSNNGNLSHIHFNFKNLNNIIL